MSALLDVPTEAQEAQAPDGRKAGTPVGLLGTCALAFLNLFWETLVFFWMWRWFVVPLGVRGLTYWHSMGLLLLVSLTRYSSSYSQNAEPLTSASRRKRIWVENVFVGSLLFMAWLVHRAMGHP